jgi:hypothetical protein
MKTSTDQGREKFKSRLDYAAAFRQALHVGHDAVSDVAVTGAI